MREVLDMLVKGLPKTAVPGDAKAERLARGLPSAWHMRDSSSSTSSSGEGMRSGLPCNILMAHRQAPLSSSLLIHPKEPPVPTLVLVPLGYSGAPDPTLGIWSLADEKGPGCNIVGCLQCWLA